MKFAPHTILGLVFVTLAHSSAPPPMVPTPSDAPALVRQLGSSEYRIRVRAAHLLTYLGKPSLPALRVGLASPDREIRRCCERLIWVVQREELDPRLVALLDGKEPVSPLPAWGRFRELVGKDLTARVFYAELFRADRPLLERLEKDPTKTASEVDGRLVNLHQTLRQIQVGKKPNSPVTTAELGLILLLANQPRSKVSRVASLHQVFWQPSPRELLTASPGLKRLLSRYFTDFGLVPSYVSRTIQLAKELSLNELLDAYKPVALQTLKSSVLGFAGKSGPQNYSVVHDAVQTVIALGAQNDIPEQVRQAIGKRLREQAANVSDIGELSGIADLLQALQMNDVQQTIIKPAVRKALRRLETQSFDFYRLYLIHRVVQSCQCADLLDEFHTTLIRKFAEAAERARTSNDVNQLYAISYYISIQEAVEGLLRPATRRLLIAYLENPGELSTLSSLYNLANNLGVHELKDLVLPFLRQRAEEMASKAPVLMEIQDLYQIAKLLGAQRVIDKQIKPALRKAFLQDATKPMNHGDLHSAFSLAIELEIKEAADLAVKIATDGKIAASTRASAVCCIAILGTSSQAQKLTPLLKDQAGVGTLYSNNEIFHAQMRDLVLAALLHQSKEKLSDYGFPSLANFNGTGASPSCSGFASDRERAVALQRWKEWSARREKKQSTR